MKEALEGEAMYQEGDVCGISQQDDTAVIYWMIVRWFRRMTLKFLAVQVQRMSSVMKVKRFVSLRNGCSRL